MALTELSRKVNMSPPRGRPLGSAPDTGPLKAAAVDLPLLSCCCGVPGGEALPTATASVHLPAWHSARFLLRMAMGRRTWLRGEAASSLPTDLQ
uniref:BR serine/threonine kinase 2 n=1 Tax=Myotis myotis TaxID=51298 RepID=A0A7J7VGI5_MYOMY|nr:BR serine/threonine kinase 2 [Myotis myotis]